MIIGILRNIKSTLGNISVSVCIVLKLMLFISQQTFLPVNSIALVKPERARQVEAMLIQMAQTGQIVGRVSYVIVIDWSQGIMAVN